MSNEKKVALVAVHAIHADPGKPEIAPGSPFEADAKTAEYLLSIGAARKPKREAAAAEVEQAEVDASGNAVDKTAKTK